MDELVICEFHMWYHSKLTWDSNCQYPAHDRLFFSWEVKENEIRIERLQRWKNILIYWVDCRAYLSWVYIYLDFISLRLQPCHPEYNGYICYIPMKHEAFQVLKCWLICMRDMSSEVCWKEHGHENENAHPHEIKTQCISTKWKPTHPQFFWTTPICWVYQRSMISQNKSEQSRKYSLACSWSDNLIRWRNNSWLPVHRSTVDDQLDSNRNLPIGRIWEISPMSSRSPGYITSNTGQSSGTPFNSIYSSNFFNANHKTAAGWVAARYPISCKADQNLNVVLHLSQLLDFSWLNHFWWRQNVKKNDCQQVHDDRAGFWMGSSQDHHIKELPVQVVYEQRCNNGNMCQLEP